jgi:hypothetical protein
MARPAELANELRAEAPYSRLPVVEPLEMHVIHACNLACESCSHYTTSGFSGLLSLEEADRWMRAWSNRIAVAQFNIMGGEPTIHPEFPSFVPLVRRHWPAARIRLITNGFFLHRHPTLPAVLAADGNADICLSIHHDAPEYRERIKPILDLMEAWQRDHGIGVELYKAFGRWSRRYRGAGKDMLPFEDGKPRQSWDICQARFCRQLFEGKLWKCPPLAYLKLVKEKYGISDKWDPYLHYQPLDPSCSDRELSEFVVREDETFCSMCSAEPRRFEMPVPFRAKAAR